jgi:O-antigen/teichoic acid export membrane protein
MSLESPNGQAQFSARDRVTRGVAWKGVSSGSTQVMRFAVGITLAHLLSPHDYGIAGMVVVFATLVFVFSDLALGAALVQREELTEADRSTVFWTSAAVGLVLTVVGVALSGPLAAFYGEPRVRPLFAAMSVTFLLAALASTQTALLTREMNFRSLELRQIGAALASGAVGVGLAAGGYGPWAVIGQQIAAIAASTALLWVAPPWRPSFVFSRASLRSVAGYSGNVFGARLLFYLNRNADNLLVGRFLGASALGAYSVAYNVILMPFSQIAVPIQDVLFPAFARLQGDVRALAAGWLRANRIVGAITTPALLGLVVVAPDFVNAVLGSRWHSAVPVVQILAWVGLIQALQGLNGSVLRAVDRTSLLLRYAVVVVTASLIAFVVGLQWGIVGVAAAYAISSTIVEPYYTWLTARAVGLTLGDFLRSLRGVAEASVLMFAVVLVARLALIEAGVGQLARLALAVLIGAAVYAPACLWRAPEVASELKVLRGRRAQRTGSIAAEPAL